MGVLSLIIFNRLMMNIGLKLLKLLKIWENYILML